MLQQLCNDVATEPPLINGRTGERLNIRSANIDDEARLGIRARSFWMRGEQEFFDVRIFNPFVSTHLQPVSKKFLCQQRKREETKVQPSCYRNGERLFYTISNVSIWRMQSNVH